MSDSVFARMAALVTVRELMTPIGPRLTTDMSMDEVAVIMTEWAIVNDLDPMEVVCLTYRGDQLVGYTTAEPSPTALLRPDPTMEEDFEPIDPTSIITADMPCFELTRQFVERRRLLFVLDQAAIVGTAWPSFCLTKLPFRMCLFALTMELEEASLQSLLMNSEAAWDALSPERQQKAIQVYEFRHGKMPDQESLPIRSLLALTMFSDKGNALRKCHVVPDMRNSDLNSVFKRAERLRNACAHSNPEGSDPLQEMGPVDLWRFIQDTTELVRMLRGRLLPRGRRDRPDQGS